jgi:uncharacterized protein
VFAEEPHNTAKLLSPFNVNVHIRRVGEDLDVSGSFKVRVEFNCDRCCDDAVVELKDNFHLILLPKAEEEDSSEEPEDEVELGYYEGEEVDLSEYVKEILFLAMPIKLLCKDDCKGICSGCGANLNKEKCSCSKGNAKGNPFGILKNKS